MKPYYEEAGITIYEADCREALAELESDSVHCCVTSPPYWGLRDYKLAPQVWGGEAGCEHEWGEAVEVNATNHTDKRRWNHTRNGRDEEQPIEKRVAWLRTKVDQGLFCQRCQAWRGALGLEPTPEMYVEHLVAIFEEVRRVLRPDGTCWLNIGDSYASLGRSAREESPGVGAKQAMNPVAREVKWKAGGGSQFSWELPGGIKPKDLCLIPFRLALALQAAGWWVRSDIIWAKPNPMPESVTDRPTTAHEHVFLLTKSAKYYYDTEAVAERAITGDLRPPNGPGHLDRPASGTRAKGNAKTFRGGGAYTGGRSFDNGQPVERESHGNEPNETGTRNLRSVWTIATQPFPDAHFATFPTKLVEPCIKAGCPAGGLVLDPFTGSGTVGLVARKLGCRFVGAELNADYIEIAAKRLSQGVFNFGPAAAEAAARDLEGLA